MALTPTDIRALLKDVPDLNILLEGVEQSGDTLINLAIRMAVSDFNALPPTTIYSLEAFPSEAVLFYGVAHFLANGEAERQLRNQVNYNAQGLNASLDDKYPQYSQLSQYYYQMYMQKASQLKQHINIESAWGQISSPYTGLNDYMYGS